MLNLSLAQHLVNTALDLARSRNQSIAVSICDTHGELISFSKMDEVSVQAGLLAQNNAYTSARDRQTSGNLGAWAKETGKDMSYWTDSRITGFKGGKLITESFQTRSQVLGN